MNYSIIARSITACALTVVTVISPSHMRSEQVNMGTVQLDKRPMRVWTKGEGVGTLANTSITNPAYIEYGGSKAPTTSSDQIPPLGSITVDGSHSVEAYSPDTGGVALQAMPGVIQWSPSPKQVQQQLQPTIITATQSTGANGTTTILVAPANGRLWGLLLTLNFSSLAAYAGGQAVLSASVFNGGNNIAATETQIASPNQTAPIVVPLFFSTPIPFNSGDLIKLSVVGLVTNTVGGVEVDIYYSTP